MDFYKTNHNKILYHLQNLSLLVFEVTDRCNLNCKYCGYSELYRVHDARIGKNISFAKAKLIIDYLCDLWKDDYSDGNNHELRIGFYGGEPLMNTPFIKQTIDYLENLELEKIGRICSYTMTTNAMLLDQYMDYLAEKKIQLLISLDGDEFAQSYRIDHSGTNSFDRVFRNIKLLQKKHPEYFKNNVNINSVLHNRNEVESIYNFVYTQFDKIPIIAPLNDVGISEENKEEFKRIYKNIMESLYHSNNCTVIESEMFMRAPRVAWLADYIKYQSGNHYNTYNDLYINRDDFPPSTGTCVPFSNRMFVTVNGKILPCERIRQQFSFGQVHEDRVELNEEYVADRHNYYISRFAKQCVNCASSRFCMHCVYQVDDICKDDARCPIFQSKMDLEKKNEEIFEFLEEYPRYYGRILEVKNTV
jgi:uncharacterized protein